MKGRNNSMKKQTAGRDNLGKLAPKRINKIECKKKD